MFRARSRNVVRLVTLALAFSSASGCAALFGMDAGSCSDCEAQTSLSPNEPLDDAAPDAAPDAGTEVPPAEPPLAEPPLAEPPLAEQQGTPLDPCETYCDLMAGTCNDSSLVPDQPYMNRAACLEICRRLPPGRAGDTSGNSLACRSSLLQSSEAQSEPALVCEAAGRGGQSGMRPVCGSNCDAYCSLMDQVCPDRNTELGGDCAAACARVPDRLAFDVTTDRAGNTVQCRLWHVGVAAECTTEECRSRHCGHAVGVDDCLPAP
ncbi:MAG: hypothetical protein RL685_4874 [Pseudomonadota bacterium]|jgi:hypothetical protein